MLSQNIYEIPIRSYIAILVRPLKILNVKKEVFCFLQKLFHQSVATDVIKCTYVVHT